MEALWVLCSLSVYPLFYMYICSLTFKPLERKTVCCLLLPAVVVASLVLLTDVSVWDWIRKIVNVIQIVYVGYFGYSRLLAFDKKLYNTCADTEGHDTNDIRTLFVVILSISFLSLVANFFGKQFFASSDWLLFVCVCTFSVLLFTLSYLCYMRQYSEQQYESDAQEDLGLDADAGGEIPAEEGTEDMLLLLGSRIDALMSEKKVYLQKDLKITTVSRMVGACRTYVSNSINKIHDCSFSDYINMKRIEYAKTLLLEDNKEKMSNVADKSGFSSEQSFFRNFKKFAGMKPSEWQKLNE